MLTPPFLAPLPLGPDIASPVLGLTQGTLWWKTTCSTQTAPCVGSQFVSEVSQAGQLHNPYEYGSLLSICLSCGCGSPLVPTKQVLVGRELMGREASADAKVKPRCSKAVWHFYFGCRRSHHDLKLSDFLWIQSIKWWLIKAGKTSITIPWALKLETFSPALKTGMSGCLRAFCSRQAATAASLLVLGHSAVQALVCRYSECVCHLLLALTFVWVEYVSCSEPSCVFEGRAPFLNLRFVLRPCTYGLLVPLNRSLGPLASSELQHPSIAPSPSIFRTMSLLRGTHVFSPHLSKCWFGTWTHHLDSVLKNKDYIVDSIP